MQYKITQSTLSNFKTYEMYKRQMLTLAENVFEFKNLPSFLSIPFINKALVRKGSIAFFKDEVMGVLALPYTILGKPDVYGRPVSIKVTSENGYTNTITDPEKFVIMYDNNGLYPIYLDIIQYAERIALETRVTDINIAQQRTPRIFKTNSDNKNTVEGLINNIDGNVNTVIAYDDNIITETEIVLNPAPFVADKIDIHKEKDWNEFLRLIGIANLNFEKKERNIKDEVLASQGGTIASRYSRYEPREKAVKEINDKFGTNIEVSYYDGLPSMIKEIEGR